MLYHPGRLKSLSKDQISGSTLREITPGERERERERESGMLQLTLAVLAFLHTISAVPVPFSASPQQNMLNVDVTTLPCIPMLTLDILFVR